MNCVKNLYCLVMRKCSGFFCFYARVNSSVLEHRELYHVYRDYFSFVSFFKELFCAHKSYSALITAIGFLIIFHGSWNSSDVVGFVETILGAFIFIFGMLFNFRRYILKTGLSSRDEWFLNRQKKSFKDDRVTNIKSVNTTTIFKKQFSDKPKAYWGISSIKFYLTVILLPVYGVWLTTQTSQVINIFFAGVVLLLCFLFILIFLGDSVYHSNREGFKKWLSELEEYRKVQHG